MRSWLAWTTLRRAVGAALRPLGAGSAGLETVFFLLILAGRVFGPGFGFVLGATTLAASALITAGVGLPRRRRVLIEDQAAKAAEISDAFETALSRGDITMAQLFDEKYRPIPDTDPQQFMTGFVALTDRQQTAWETYQRMRVRLAGRDRHRPASAPLSRPHSTNVGRGFSPPLSWAAGRKFSNTRKL